MGKITFRARGHPNITARHKTTLMITKEPQVGTKGDCIIGVCAERSVLDLPNEIKEEIKAGKEICITIKVGETSETVRARGHPLLPLNNPTDMVVRKSNYICGRTLAIFADRASGDLSRKFVHLLQRSDAVLDITVELL